VILWKNNNRMKRLTSFRNDSYIFSYWRTQEGTKIIAGIILRKIEQAHHTTFYWTLEKDLWISSNILGFHQHTCTWIKDIWFQFYLFNYHQNWTSTARHRNSKLLPTNDTWMSRSQIMFAYAKDSIILRWMMGQLTYSKILGHILDQTVQMYDLRPVFYQRVHCLRNGFCIAHFILEINWPSHAYSTKIEGQIRGFFRQSNSVTRSSPWSRECVFEVAMGVPYITNSTAQEYPLSRTIERMDTDNIRFINAVHPRLVGDTPDGGGNFTNFKDKAVAFASTWIPWWGIPLFVSCTNRFFYRIFIRYKTI